MLEEIKGILADKAANYTDAQIQHYYNLAAAEVKEYCKRELDDTLKLIVQQITIIKLNRIDTEGLNSQSYSGVNESYINGYPAEIVAVLNRKRKLKVI